MPLTNAYHDAYLASLVTPEREVRAAADVGQLGSFTDAWLARLTVLRAYVLTCMESQKAPDDLFSAKLAEYRREFDRLLPAATAAALAEQAATSGGRRSPLVVDIERG